MANQALHPRKVVLIYNRETDGTWRSHRVTVAQGGAATVNTLTNAELDALKQATRDAAGQAAIHSEHVVMDNHA